MANVQDLTDIILSGPTVKDSQRSMRATLNVTGFAPVSARVQQYGAFNDAVDAGVTTYEVAVPGPRFAFVFPSYSMTVLTLKPAKP